MMVRLSLFVLLLIPPLYRLIRSCHGSLFNLRASSDSVLLSFSPNDLSLSDIILVICVFIGRSIKHAVGLETHFSHNSGLEASKEHNSSVAGTNPIKNEQDHDEILHLPSKSLTMPLRVRQDDIKSFVHAISPASTTNTRQSKPQSQLHLDTLTSSPAHLSLFLSAISEPALLLLLARKGCPVAPLGAVNVRNRFEILRPDLCIQMIEDTINANSANESEQRRHRYTVLASLPKSARRAKRGIEFDITVSISADHSSLSVANVSAGEPESTRIFEQIFTILQFVRSNGIVESTLKPPLPSGNQTLSQDSSTGTIHLDLPSNLPMEWATLCKDYNPIHLSTVMAKLYGFKGKLAHGNHVAARALEALKTKQASDQKVLEETKDTGGGIIWRNKIEKTWTEVKFKRPVVVPGRIGVRLVSGRSQKILEDEPSERHDSMALEIFVHSKRDIKVCIEDDMGIL